jgi:hypothetical protein
MLPSAKEEKVAKLTDTQLNVLSNATARNDGAGVVPNRVNKAAAAKVATSLVGRKLMREVRTKRGMPAWRQDETGRSISLIITQAGRDAIGVEDGNTSDQQVANKTDDVKTIADQSSSSAPRPGSKQALVIGMLARDGVRRSMRWRARDEAKGSIYRIVPDPKQPIPA